VSSRRLFQSVDVIVRGDRSWSCVGARRRGRAARVQHLVDVVRLIEATGGDIVGAKLDPSHLMSMGADIPTVIRTLGDAIFHVHAKGIHINDWISARDRLLDTVFITELHSRA
jgi:hypothetical protein